MITYCELLNRLNEDERDNHLLLGNGFNISLGVFTDYKNIFNKMKEKYNGYEDLNINGNYDIENIIGELKNQIPVNSSHKLFLDSFINNKVKSDFMKSAYKIAKEGVKEIYSDKNYGVGILFENFTNFFTLNYDPFLYLMLMKYKKTDLDIALSFQHTLGFKKTDADIFSKGEGYVWEGVFYPGQDVFYNKDIKTTGYFAQHQYQSDKLSTQLGVRLEDHEKFGTHTIGQVAARYFITPATSIYSNIGTAFRAPTNNDLYAIGWGANPDLAPEESLSYEVGFDHQINKQLSTSLSVYRTEIDNLITSINSQLININETTFTGGEISFNWQQDQLFLNTTYAYVQAKDDQTKKDLNRRPRQNLTLTAGWDDGEYGISASLSAKSNSKDFADSKNTPPSIIPGYVTTNVNAYWQVTPMIKFFTNIENIGDVKYKTAYNGSNVYYINGGRLASAGVTFRY